MEPLIRAPFTYIHNAMNRIHFAYDPLLTFCMTLMEPIMLTSAGERQPVL